MVTGLQLPLQNFFADESAASKSHSRESEMIQGLTFGGILRAKEKQLQDAQTVSASSIAAAVAAWQTLPVMKISRETVAGQVLVDLQVSGLETGAATEAELQKTRVDQPEKAGSPVLGVAVPPESAQVTAQTEVLAPAAETGTELQAGKAGSQPQLFSLPALLEAGQRPDEEATVEPRSKQFQPGQAPADPVEEIKGREPGVPVGQIPALEARFVFRQTQPEAQQTSQNEATRSEAVASVSLATEASRPSQAEAGAEHPNPTIKTASQMPAAPKFGSGGQFQAAVASTNLRANPGGEEAAENRPASGVMKPAPSQSTIPVAASGSTLMHDSPEMSINRQQVQNDAKTGLTPDMTNRRNDPVRASANDTQSISEPRESPVPPGARPVERTNHDLPEIERSQATVPARESAMSGKQESDPATLLQPEKVRVATETPVPVPFSTKLDENRPGMQPVALTESQDLDVTRPGREIQSAPLDPAHESPAVKMAVAGLQNHVEPAASNISVAQAASVQRTAQGSSNSGVVQAVVVAQEVVATAGESSLPAVPLQSTGQDSAQPVHTAQDSVKEARRVSVLGNATEPENANGKSAAKRPESMPALEGAASQAPQLRGNSVESVAGQGGRTGAKIPATEVIQQIAHHVEARVRERSTEMRLQLNPKELGIIEVQMVSGPQGVSVTFSAEQPATGRLLETQLNQLHQALREAGVQIAGLNIGQHSQPRQEGGFPHQTPQFIPLPQRDDSPTGVIVQEPRSPIRRTGRPGEVDYLI